MKNIRQVGWGSTLCCAAAMAAVVLLLAGCGERRSEQYRIEGDSYCVLKKYADAESSYRGALRSNPKNLAARIGLGRCLAATKKPDEALACFQEAIKTDPSADTGYFEAVNLLLDQAKPEEAMDIAKQFESVDPESGGVLKASLLSRAGKNSEALTLLTGLAGRFSISPRVHTHLACVALAAGDLKTAESELDLVIGKLDERAIGAKMLSAELPDAQRVPGGLIDRLWKLKARPEDQSLVLAHALIRAKRTEEGENIVREVMAKNPASAWANYVWGAALLDKGRNEAALASLQAAAILLPDEAVVTRDLAAAQQSAPARSVTTQAPAASPKEPSAEPKTAAAPEAASSGDWQSLWRQASLRQLVESRDKFTGAEGYLNERLFLAALFSGNSAVAEELAQKLPADSPFPAYLKGLKDKQPKDIVQALEPWAKQEGDPRLLAQNALGFAMGRLGSRAQAVQVLAECRAKYPEDGVSLYNLALVFRAANMPKFAARSLQRLTAAYPDNVEAQLLTVGLLRDAGEPLEARQAAEITYALFSGSRDANMAICGVYMDTGELALARKIVDRYLESHADDADMQLLHASIQLREGHPEEAAKALDAMTASEELAQRLLTLKVLCKGVPQDWPGVVALAGAADPASLALPARFMLAAACLKSGEKDKVAALLKQPDKDEPFGGPMGSVVLRAAGLPAAKLSDGETLLAQALASKPEAQVDFAAGIACQSAQLPDDAFDAFKRVQGVLPGDYDVLLDGLFLNLAHVARTKDPAQEARALAEKHKMDPKAWLGYSSVLESVGKKEDVLAAINKAVEVEPNDPNVLFAKGRYYTLQKDTKEAITALRHLVQVRPDDSIANNNLAYHLLMAGGDEKEALHCAEVAQKGMPNDPFVVHTLGVAQLRVGDFEHSQKNLEMALQLKPGEPALLLDYGKLLIALQRKDEGRHHIEAALSYAKEMGLDFDRKAEAEEILSKTSAPDGIAAPTST